MTNTRSNYRGLVGTDLNTLHIFVHWILTEAPELDGIIISYSQSKEEES